MVDALLQTSASGKSANIHSDRVHDSLGSTVEIWRKMMAEDVQNGKAVDEYRVGTILGKADNETISRIAEYIINNYEISLRLPLGKICLVSFRDDLSDDEKIQYAKEHILVLLYSIKSRKIKASPAHKSDQTTRKTLPKSKLLYKVVQGNVSIEIKTGDLTAVKMSAAELRTIINTSIEAARTLQRVYKKKISIPIDIDSDLLDRETSSASKYGIIINPIDIVQERLKNALMHEIGHLIYYHIGYESNLYRSNNSDWQNIYFSSMHFDDHKIVDDSSYSNETDRFGHPDSNPDELFASSFAIFLIHHDEFVRNITDPDCSESMRTFGLLVYCYFKDVLFPSNDICGNDSIRSNTWDQVSRGIDTNELIQNIRAMMHSRDFERNVNGYVGANLFGIWDERYAKYIVNYLNGKNADSLNLTLEVVNGMCSLKDPKLLPYLIPMINDRSLQVSCLTMNTLSCMGIKDRSLIAPVMKAMSRTSPAFDDPYEGDIISFEYQGTIDRIFYSLKDKMFLPPLIKKIRWGNDDDKCAALMALRAMEIYDDTIREPVIDCLRSENPRVSGTAEIPIRILDNAGFNDLLLGLLISKEHRLHLAAAKSLGKINAQDPRIRARLLELQNEPECGPEIKPLMIELDKK